MFALYVNKLGARERVELPPAATLADLRQHLERGVPKFHDVHIVQGFEELSDDDALQVEVTAVVTKSPEKAFAALDEGVRKWKQSEDALNEGAEGRRTNSALLFRIGSREWQLAEEEDARAYRQLEVERSALAEALFFAPAVALAETEALSADHAARLLNLLESEFTDLQLWEGDVDLMYLLAKAFGRGCGDPALYAHQLLRMHSHTLFLWFVMRVWLEIADRYGMVLPKDFRMQLIEIAMDHLQASIPSTQELQSQYTIDCMRLLGHIGGEEHIELLQTLIRRFGELPMEPLHHIYPSIDSFCKAAEGAATEALALICARVHPQPASGLALAEKAFACDDSPVAPAEVGCGDQVETDPYFDVALAESEQDALLLEQGDLHEAVLRSKAESLPCRSGLDASSEHAASDDGLVLIGFNRCPKELHQALLESNFATRLAASGVDLKPAWADGRLVLAEGATEVDVSEAREAWHVAVRAANIAEVDAICLRFARNVRPRVKSQFLVAGAVSLFDDVSAAGATHGAQSSYPPLRDVEEEQMVITRTFLHVPSEPLASPRTCASAPPGF